MPRLDQRLGFTRFEADEYYKQGLDAYRKSDFDAALDALTSAIDLLPTRAELYAARGFIFLEDGETQKAIEDFEAALKHFPYEMLAHYGLGMIAYRDQNWDKAVEHFNRALYADPKRPETQYYPRAFELMNKAQQGMEQSNHKGKADAGRWLRELSRLLRASLQRPLLEDDAGQ